MKKGNQLVERILLSVPKELKERLVEEAKADRRSISNHIIVNYLEKQDAEVKRKHTGPRVLPLQ
jgi:hypothetical protein